VSNSKAQQLSLTITRGRKCTQEVENSTVDRVRCLGEGKQVSPHFHLIFVRRITFNTSRIELTLDRLPSERYKRNVVRGKLDMVGEYAKKQNARST